MAQEVAVNLATKAAENLISQIWQDLQCLLNYNNNIKTLKEKVEDLECEKSTIKVRVDDAIRDGQVIMDNVSSWMVKVDNMKKQVNEILTRTSNNQWGCLSCKCPKLHSRYKLSKQALELTTEVSVLKTDASNFNTIGYHAPPGQMPFTSVQKFEYESRTRTSNDVMEALRDNSITSIGICGMAGVGKTTLVNEIADKVKGAKLFDEVIKAVVSKDPVIGNIRDQLAESLGLKIEEKTDHRRAERLYERLVKKDKRILVILDDLWEKLDFSEIGIPIECEHYGIKVLLTSRKKEVCIDMKAKPIEVNVLSTDESWNLFKGIAEISENSNEIAKEVAKECGGLPLAIVIVGGALKGKPDYFWREVFRQLKEGSVTSIPDVRRKVNSAIELSYTYLEKESKLLLLLCSLFPEDYNIPVEDLIRYVNGLQWFINVKTMDRLRDKVELIKDDLRSCYLLLAGTDEKHVKLHDVVRDVCLSIATSGEHTHTVRHDALREWPQDDRCLSSTAISLSFDEIDQLCCGVECGELKLLRLSFKEHKLLMHRDFFNGMKEIKVLEVCNFNGELPSSLGLLVNLRTLCFHNCKLDGDMSVIGSQTKLEILSFYNSLLEKFPDKISKLSNLKCLDIRFKEGPSLPSGILSKLQNLEDLYLGSHKRGEEDSVIITDLSSLQNLQTFQYCANGSNQCLEQVLDNLHYEKLKRFEIFSEYSYIKKMGEYQVENVLYFNAINVDLLKKQVTRYLLSNTKDLSLSYTNGLPNPICELDPKGFMNLKKLNLDSCDFECFIDGSRLDTRGGGGVFINLEKLIIHCAEKLEELCHGNLPSGSLARLREVELHYLPSLRHLWSDVEQPFLGNLRSIRLWKCNSIRKSLFPKSAVKYLLQLEEINIRNCDQLETIVSNDEENDPEDIELPMLKDLVLQDLRSFKTFSTNSMCGGLFEKIILPNLKNLTIFDAHYIKWIANGQMPASDLRRMLHSLQQINVNSCHSVEVLFDFTGLKINGEESLQTLLARLESMHLSFLFNLKHLWRRLPEGIYAFKNLRNLSVNCCSMSRYLLSPSMAKMLVGLETLRLFQCKEMEAIIGVDATEIVETEFDEENVKKEKNKHEEERVNKIVLPKLKNLNIMYCDDFRMLCSINVDLELPSLTKLLIHKNPKMNKFCAGQLRAPNLDSVTVEITTSRWSFKYVEKKVDEFSSWLKDCESGIRCLNCSIEEIESCAHLD